MSELNDHRRQYVEMAALSHEVLERLQRPGPQLAAVRSIAEIKAIIDSLPEDRPILGVVFGIAVLSAENVIDAKTRGFGPDEIAAILLSALATEQAVSA